MKLTAKLTKYGMVPLIRQEAVSRPIKLKTTMMLNPVFWPLPAISNNCFTLKPL